MKAVQVSKESFVSAQADRAGVARTTHTHATQVAIRNDAALTAPATGVTLIDSAMSKIEPVAKRPATTDREIAHDTLNGSILSSCGTVESFPTNAEELLSADNRQSSTSPDQNGLIVHEKPSTRLARKILGLIQTYGQNVVTRDDTWLSKAKFTLVVESQIVSHEAVRLILPAFPSKSANKLDKVLGPLPDLGEELALAHLNGLCHNIADIYEPGATVTILSDGLVYNDLDFTPDEEVWNYTEALRQIVLVKGFSTNIKFIRIMDLLGLHSSRAITKEEYLALISECRKELMARFGDPNFDFQLEISQNQDTCMTYSGYKRFLQKDLLYTDYARNSSSKRAYRKICGKVAADMITRGKASVFIRRATGTAFARLIEVKCPDYVRLSIHPSTNETKLSLPLIPQELNKFSMTPWHCAVAINVNGSFKTAHVSYLQKTHDIIYSGSRPSYFRERSALYNLGASVELEHLYPYGLIVRPAQNAGPLSILDINMENLRKLGERQSLIILRDFNKITKRGVFVEAACKIGEVLSSSLGKVEKIFNHRMDHIYRGIDDSSFTTPMHFNNTVGSTVNSFQCADHAGNEQHNNPESYKWPRFELFTCVDTSTQGCGDTLFASSRRLFQYLSYLYPVESLEKVTCKLQNDGLRVHNELKGPPLVVQHPMQHMPCLNSQSKITAENSNEDITKTINDLLCDRRVCLRFSWKNGDVLLLDNTAILHVGAPHLGEKGREIWRVRLN